MALPLETALVDALAPGASGGAGPAIVMLFVPRSRARAARARTLVAEALATEGLTISTLRRVPTDASALGSAAADSRPDVLQAIVPRAAGPDGRPLTDADFERRLVLARRRLESRARAEGLDDLSVPSASCRTIVYKGLVAGARLADLFPDLALPIPLSYALFHQRYATNTHPAWRLAQPFRSIAHNGEIDTVRGNREQVRGRVGRRRPRRSRERDCPGPRPGWTAPGT